METFCDVWNIDESASWRIVEDICEKSDAASVVDGKIVLGVLEGPFFVPGGASLNQRFYPKDLWEDVLSSEPIRNRLKNKTMFGMIGHEEKPVSEVDIREGRVSHIVTKLWIDEHGRGMGRAHILNTESGRNLYILMKAGSKLKTSSRATGKYVDGKTQDGMPVVDKSTYRLETFDIVINPGFSAVDPALVESRLSEALERNRKELQQMDHSEALKVLQESRDALQRDLLRAQDSETALRDKCARLERENALLSEAAERMKGLADLGVSGKDAQALSGLMERLGLSGAASLTDVLAEARKEDVEVLRNGKLAEMAAELQGYRDLGTLEDVEKALTESKEILDRYAAIGSPEEIQEHLDAAADLLEEYREAVGPVDEAETIVERAADLLEEYAKFGSPADVERSMDEARQALQDYREVGTIDEVRAVARAYADLIDEQTEREFADQSEKLANQHSITVEDARELLEELGAEKAEKFLRSVRGSRQSEPARSTRVEVIDESDNRSGRSSGAAGYFKSITGKRAG